MFEKIFDPKHNQAVTIIGTKYYFGNEVFKPGQVLLCQKEYDNKIDQEAIAVKLPIIGTVGYLANNPKTVVQGTNSAGRIYDKVDEYFFIRLVIFDGYLLIGQIEDKPFEELEKEWKNLVR